MFINLDLNQAKMQAVYYVSAKSVGGKFTTPPRDNREKAEQDYENLIERLCKNRDSKMTLRLIKCIEDAEEVIQKKTLE